MTLEMITVSDRQRGSYPALATVFDSWVCWMDNDGRKQPFSPYSDLPRYTDDDSDDKFSWSNPENLTDFDSARDWAKKHPNLKGVGFILQHESDPYQEPADPLVFIDLDDVIDKNGNVHPYAAMLVERADTYADVSVSDTGIHIIGVGELPEGIRTVQDELPEHDDFPEAEIEVYDRKRFCAMTGKWITASNREVTDVTYWVNRLARRFDTENQTGTSDSVAHDVNIQNAAFEDMETTNDFDQILDAISSVGEQDITLKSTEDRQRPSGVIDYDPAYRQSDSGASLGWFPDNEVWCDRDGEHYMDALQLVALEESLIHRPTEYPEGDAFWKAVERLRERGANIPRFEGKPADLHGFHKRNQSKEQQAKNAVKKLQLLD